MNSVSNRFSDNDEVEPQVSGQPTGSIRGISLLRGLDVNQCSEPPTRARWRRGDDTFFPSGDDVLNPHTPSAAYENGSWGLLSKHLVQCPEPDTMATRAVAHSGLARNNAGLATRQNKKSKRPLEKALNSREDWSPIARLGIHGAADTLDVLDGWPL